MTRVRVCDDHLSVRQGIRQVLADAADIEVAAEAASGPDALAQVRAGGIDVVLLDVAMPQRDGLDNLRQLKSEAPKLPVLMLSTYPDRQYAVRSLKSRIPGLPPAGRRPQRGRDRRAAGAGAEHRQHLARASWKRPARATTSNGRCWPYGKPCRSGGPQAGSVSPATACAMQASSAASS